MKKLFINLVLLAAGLLVGTNAWGASVSFIVKDAGGTKVGTTQTTLDGAIALLPQDVAEGYTITLSGANYTVPVGTYDLKGATLSLGKYLSANAEGTYTFKNAKIIGSSYIYQVTKANTIVLDNVQMTTTGAYSIYNNIASANLTLKNNSSASLQMSRVMTSISVEDGSSLNLISGTFTKVNFTGLEKCTITGGTFAIASLETVRSKMAEGKYLFRKSSTCVVSTEDKATAQIEGQEEKFLLPSDAFACATEGATINLLAPVTDAVTISKNITIDLNGNNLTGTNNKSAFTLSTANKTLTLKNSGASASVTTQHSNTTTYYVATLTKAACIVVEGDITMDAASTGGISINMGNASASALLKANVTASVNAASSSDIVAMPNSHVTIVGGTLENCKLAQGTTLASSVEIKGGFYGDKFENNLVVEGRSFLESSCEELGSCYEVQGSNKIASINGGAAMTLMQALAEVEDNDVITLSGNYVCCGERLNITKSITLDGQGHTISGWGICENVNTKGYDGVDFKTTIAINVGGSTKIDVIFKNVTIENTNGHSIDTHGNLGSLTMENCKIITSSRGLFIGGNQTDIANITINNTEFDCGNTGWAIAVYNPINLQMENSITKGWNAVTFKGPWQPNKQANNNNCEGSHGSTATLVNCNFDATNYLSGGSNGYAVFVVEDDNIDIHLTDCGMNAEALGNAQQVLFGPADYPYIRSKENPIRLTIDGNNSHLNGLFYNVCATYYNRVDNVPEWQTEIVVKGGTYSEDPSKAAWNLDSDPDENPDAQISEWNDFVPEGYEVSEVTQYVEGKAPVTLYRVHPKAAKDEHGVAYKLNDDVESQGGGQNPNTSFILSANETVAAEKTYAEYVEVNAGTITIPTGKALSVGEGGLVIQQGASMVVEPGGTLTVSKGGAITAEEQSIVIKSNVDETGNYLLDPAVTFNQQPLAKVELYTTAKKNKWQRFAFPLVEGTYGGNVTNDHEDLSLTIVGGGNFGTAINEWDYVNDEWKAINSTTPMKPFIGYALSNNSAEGGVTYTFHGNIMGNVVDNLNFATNSYTLFGNSYTAPIDIKQLIATVKEKAGDVAGSIYLWSVANQGYVAENFTTIEEDFSDYTEIPALHTFIMLNNGQETTTALDYEATIWQPMMNKLYPSAPAAPKRYAAQQGNMMRLRVSSENGHADDIVLMEQGNFSAHFEDGADADKYFNNGNVNIFTTVDDKDLAILASDNIEGVNLSLKTISDINYTITIAKAIGSDYALKDNLTGIVTPIYEGETYSFTAQANTTLDGRFQIIGVRKMPTNNESIVANPSAKGIYTMIGQYIGEESMWSVLPAGVYVVNGQRIVK